MLSEEVQPWTSQQLAEAEQDASDAIRNVYVAVGILLLFGLLVGALAATLINRGIIGSVRKLTEGANRIGRGDLDHRVDLNTSDELGVVAAAFNDMLDKRHEANAALRDSEERFRGLSDATFEGIAITEDGRVLETNRAFAELFGYEMSEVVGMSAEDFIAPESRETVRQNISSGLEEPYEVVGLKKDGTNFDLEVRGMASSYRGRVVRIAAIRDITGRKRAEEALRQSEERYRLVARATNEAIWDSDVLADRQTWNGAVEAMFGYPAGLQTNAAWWEDHVHPEDRERVLSGIEEVLQGDGEMWSEEYRFRRADGGYSTVVDRAYVARDERGEPVRMIGSMMDITERKRAELVVRENERRVRQLFNQSVDALFVHDASGNIVDCNEEACRSLGYSREELLSLRIMDIASDLVPDQEERPRTEPTLWQRALSGEPGQVAGVHRGGHRRKDGTTFPVEVYVGSVDYGGERMLLASARDVTERRRAEELLQEAEARYRTLVEKMPAVTYLQEIGSPDAAMYMSPQIETLTGYSPEDCKDPDLRFRMVHPDDRERIQSQDEQTGEPGEVITTEYRVTASRVNSLHRRLSEQKADLERLNRELFEMSRVDPLTGLGNRLRLREDLETFGAHAERYGHAFSAMLCDIDFFKSYNDAYGHLAGDEVLEKVANVISGNLRTGDMAYRYGGEEFLIVLPEQDLKSAGVPAERLRRGVEELAIFHGAKTPPGVLTISVGLAALSAGERKTIADLLKEADEALYGAKEAGRNRVMTHDEVVS